MERLKQLPSKLTVIDQTKPDGFMFSWNDFEIGIKTLARRSAAPQKRLKSDVFGCLKMLRLSDAL